MEKKKSDVKIAIGRETKLADARLKGGNLQSGERDCPIHGNLGVRGRTFQGRVTKKFDKRVVIEFDRMIKIRKYERYMKKRTKLHARLSDCMKSQINVGDLIKIQECRPLSKLIKFVVINRVKEADQKVNVGGKEK